MKIKKDIDMTNSTFSQQIGNSLSTAYVLNFLGVIAGGMVAVASLVAMSPIGFFLGLAGAMFCLDGVR